MRRMTCILASIAILAGTVAFGQAAADLTFDVATVKPFVQPQPQAGGGIIRLGVRGGPGTNDPGQMTWSGLALFNLITTAYEMKPFQVTGPEWLKTERYEVVAKVPAGATKEQTNVMLQNLLKERFGMVLHRESKEFDVEELSVAKGGPKFKETDLDPNAPPPPNTGEPQPIKMGPDGLPQMPGPGMMTMINVGKDGGGPVGHMVGKAQTMAQLANMLGNQLNHPVVDKTELTGKYDFTVEFTPDMSGIRIAPGAGPAGLTAAAPGGDSPAATDPGSNQAEAVQKQLGLKLTKAKAKLDVLIIDKMNKEPTEN